jgi:hypothetical protein
MKQALEACKGVWNGGLPFHHVERMGKAIKALEEALAKQEQGDPVAKPKLIGWRTADFLNETTDIRSARNWEVHYEVLPIFEGDPNTKLTTPPQQRKPLTDEQMHEAIGTAGVDLLELAKLWSDNEIHVYQFDNEARKIIKAVLLRAHGIKGEA